MFTARLLTLLCAALAPAAVFSCGSDAPSSIGDEGASPPDAAQAQEAPQDREVTDGSVLDGAASAPRCKGRTGAAGQRTVSLSSGGRSRTFDVHVPSTYDATKPTPVVLVFHGFTMTSAAIRAASRFTDMADKRGMIVAFPSGVGASFNAGDCCGGAVASKVDDVAFARDVIASLGEAYCLDDKRVFATGFSNGGFLSYRLACELSETIAAVAPVSGTLGVAGCAPKRPVPLLHLHGTGDLVIPFNGGGTLGTRPVRQSIDTFRQRNGCAPGDGKTTYEKGDVSCTTWGACAAGADVALCTVRGGGHQWPGGEPMPLHGPATTDINGSEAIADFFAAHPMP